MLNHPVLRLIVKFLLYSVILNIVFIVTFSCTLLPMLFLGLMLSPSGDIGQIIGLMFVLLLPIEGGLVLWLTNKIFSWLLNRPKQKAKRKPHPMV